MLRDSSGGDMIQGPHHRGPFSFRKLIMPGVGPGVSSSVCGRLVDISRSCSATFIVSLVAICSARTMAPLVVYVHVPAARYHRGSSWYP